MKPLSHIAEQVNESSTLAMDALYKQMKADGIDVLGFAAGEPDFPTPDRIKLAAIEAIINNDTKYTPATGTLVLKKAICQRLKADCGVEYQPSQIIVSSGAKHCIYLVMQSLVNEGDEVIIPTPAWVSYSEMTKMAGGVPVFIPCGEAEHFKLTPERLEAAITDKTKCIFFNNPSNPTGMMYGEEELRGIADVVVQNDLYVISDEIYAELTYDGKFASLAQFDEIKDQVIVINGFSKAFAMTGWRLGYILANPTLIQAMNKIHQYIIMSAPTAAQYGAIEGLRKGLPHVQEMVDSYRARRNFIVSGFNQIGLQCHLPHGAFYVFPDIRKTGLSSDAFCELLLKEEKVACVPGTAFGEAGEGFVRVSYAYSIDHIREALARIEHFLKKFNLAR